MKLNITLGLALLTINLCSQDETTKRFRTIGQQMYMQDYYNQQKTAAAEQAYRDRLQMEASLRRMKEYNAQQREKADTTPPSADTDKNKA